MNQINQQENQSPFIKNGWLFFKGIHAPLNDSGFNLEKNLITKTEALQLFPLLSKFKNLTKINLGGSHLEDEVFACLVPHIPRMIEDLYLENNCITSNGATMLAQRLHNNLNFPNFHDLILSKNQIGDEGGIALARAIVQHRPMCRKLFIQENPISQAGHQQIKEILAPKYHIIGADFPGMKEGRYALLPNHGLNIQNFINQTQDLVNKVRSSYVNIQAPEINLSYQTFYGLFSLFFTDNVDDIEYNGFKLVPSQTTKLNDMGVHIKGQNVFNAQMSQLEENVIFTSGFLNAANIANLPENYRNNNHKSASFVFPVSAHENYEQKNYEFFVVQNIENQI
jgi:hypothetical protein